MDAKLKLIHLQKSEKNSFKKLLEIYPEAKNIPEIVEIINKENK